MSKIEVRLIIEMMGRPIEHLFDALKQTVQRLEKEQGVKIIDKTLHEPIPVQEVKNLFTTFAEITAELDDMSVYFRVIFGYFPANIEIITPEELKIRNQHLNELGGQLVQRLHEYDAIAKKMLTDNQILANRIKEIDPAFLGLSSDGKPLTSPAQASSLEQAVQQEAEKASNIPSTKEKKRKKSKG